MTWVPIADSSVNYSFGQGIGVVMSGSIVSANNAWGANFSFGIEGVADIKLRVTNLEYHMDFSEGTSYFVWPGGEQYNEANGTTDSWLPQTFEAVISADGGNLQYNQATGSQETYQFLIEVWQDDPPASPKPPHVINHVLRGYAGADSALSAWIRSEAGPLDLSGSALSVRIKSYKGHVISSYPASGTAGGEMTCTITEAFGRINGTGVYRFDVLDAATGVIAIGILEVV